MSLKLKHLDNYDINLLADPEIGNTEIERERFISDSGIVFYGERKVGLSPISFSLEFRGDKDEIRRNKNMIADRLELEEITFDDDIYYKGRFLGKTSKVMYKFEVVDYEGEAYAMKAKTVVKLTKDIPTRLVNDGNLKTPVKISLKGTGSNITITGFDSDITVKSLSGELEIDAQSGISDAKGINNVKLYSFPFIEDERLVKVSGSGTFSCEIEFRGRVIC